MPEMLAKDDEPGVAMTYAEFLDWADEDTLAEWVNGKVIMTSPASLRQQGFTSEPDKP